VLENISDNPTIRLSDHEKLNSLAISIAGRAKSRHVAKVIGAVSLRSLDSFCGCRFRPIRNISRIIPR